MLLSWTNFFSRHIKNLHFFFFNKMKAALFCASIFFPLLLIIFLFFGSRLFLFFLIFSFSFLPLISLLFFLDHVYSVPFLFLISLFSFSISSVYFNFKNCSKLTILYIYNQKNIPSFLVINQMNNILFRLMII